MSEQPRKYYHRTMSENHLVRDAISLWNVLSDGERAEFLDIIQDDVAANTVERMEPLAQELGLSGWLKNLWDKRT